MQNTIVSTLQFTPYVADLGVPKYRSITLAISHGVSHHFDEAPLYDHDFSLLLVSGRGESRFWVQAAPMSLIIHAQESTRRS